MTTTAPLIVGAHLHDQENDYRQRLVDVNDFLIERGRFVAPCYIPMIAIHELQSLGSVIRTTTDSNVIAATYDAANKVIGKYCFHPRYRAFMLHRASKLPYLNEVAHYLDRAALHYYREDYLSAVLLLTPTVENLLNRHYGYHVSHLREVVRLVQSDYRKDIIGSRPPFCGTVPALSPLHHAIP